MCLLRNDKRNLMEIIRNPLFWRPKRPKLAKIMSRRLGTSLGSDDVHSRSAICFHITLLCFCRGSVKKYQGKLRHLRSFSRKMSDSDEVMSLTDSVSNETSSEKSDSDEMEVVGMVQPYADEPLAHTSDEDEDEQDDQDGLTPAVLRARFEGEVSVNDWLVL